MGKAKRRKKSRKLDWLNWLLYTILVSLPTAWFTFVVPYYGDILKVTKNVEEQVRFTKLGVFLTIVIVIIMLVVVYFNNRHRVKSEVDDLKYELSYLRTITDKVDHICDDKYVQLQRSIVDIKTNGTEPPKIVSQPNHQLKVILDGITSCLVTFMETPDNSYSFKDFYVTLTYNFPQENNKWEWTDGITEKDMTLEDLLSNGAKSTFNYLRESNKPYYFNNKKEDAKKEDRYLYNPQDEINADNGEPVGSIFCYNFKIKKGNIVYIDAMLSISTQKKRFAPEEDEQQCKNARDNLILLVKDYFGKRIGIELSLLYLEYIKQHEKSK